MEAAWKSIVDVNCVFEFKTFNMTITGQDSVWAFRQGLTANVDNARLDWGIFAGAYSMLASGAVRTSTDMVAFKNDASTYELGRFFEIIQWTASFNEDGLMSTVVVEQLWFNYEDGDFGRRRRMLSELGQPTDKTKEPSSPQPPPARLASLRTRSVAKTSNAMAAAASPRRSLLADDDDASEEFISGTYGWNTVSSTKQACTSPIVAILSASIALSFRQCDAHRLSS